MNNIDIAITIIVLLALARGFQKGLVQSFIGLIGWLVALIVASKFAHSAGSIFSGWVASPQLQIALGFLFIVLIVITVLHIITAIVNSILQGLNLKILDRFAGGVFGAAKGLLIVLIIMSMTAPIMQRFNFWKSSVFIPELLPFAPVAMQLTKSMMQHSVKDILPEELKKQPDNTENNHQLPNAESNNHANNKTSDNIEDVSLEDISVINDDAFKDK